MTSQAPRITRQGVAQQHPISADGIELFNPETIPITRYRYRGNKIPTPGAQTA